MPTLWVNPKHHDVVVAELNKVAAMRDYFQKVAAARLANFLAAEDLNDKLSEQAEQMAAEIEALEEFKHWATEKIGQLSLDKAELIATNTRLQQRNIRRHMRNHSSLLAKLAEYDSAPCRCVYPDKCSCSPRPAEESPEDGA